jgi:TatD DNase family protein
MHFAEFKPYENFLTFEAQSFMNRLIDTHCHLYLEEFSNDLEQVIKRAESEGVTKFFMPAIDSSQTSNLFETEKRFKGKCIPMMGLHPCSVKENYQVELRMVKDWLEKRPFAAVGEIGLDYYWDLSFQSQQVEAFEFQIKLAIRHGLSIVIHSRNSLDDCISLVGQYKGQLTGIYHCFSGSLQQAQAIIDLGFYLGIGGVLTYKNAGLAEVVKDIPLENIVLETDSPYLTPVPFRGKRNESSYLKYVVQKLAEVKGISVEDVAKETTVNEGKIFKEFEYT